MRTSDKPGQSSVDPMKTGDSRTIRRKGGWILWAVLGTLAVMAVLALAVAVVWVRQYDMRMREAEKQALADIGEAFRRVVIETATIPSPTNFASVVALRTGKSLAQVQFNRRTGPRVVIADPDLGLGTNGTGKLTYTQGRFGSLYPVNPRLVLLSSLSRPLPAGLTTGATLTTAQFSNVWNTIQGARPAGWVWDGDPNDLFVQRVHLGDLFVKLKLQYYTKTNATDRGYYAVTSSPLLAEANRASLAAPDYALTNYYIRGSYLSLYGPDGVLQFRDILQDDGLIYTCQNRVWRQGLGSRGFRVGPVIRHPTPEEFADCLEIFLTQELWAGNPDVSLSDMLYNITNFLATCAYDATDGHRLQAQSDLLDAWADFTGASINKP